MKSRKEKASQTWQWRLECLAHSVIEGIAALLPGPWVFRLGEALGSLAWHLLPQRRKIVLRNLRIAYAGEKSLTEIHALARASFLRTGANLVCAAHTARLPEARLKKILHVENPGLLAETLAQGRGLVILLAHMGNWELLTRLVHFFPPGSKCGAFYRPLNNPLLDERVLRRRQAHGTRMFSKRDPFHQVTAFLREGGIVGILADQRVGTQGDMVNFFGRLTRASPLPSLLARRAKSPVLALSLTTTAPGKWQARFLPVEAPPTTQHCMYALETAMKAEPTDVFWLQERWKIQPRRRQRPFHFLGLDGIESCGKPHRALLWLVDAPQDWELPDDWRHPDLSYQIVTRPPSATSSIAELRQYLQGLEYLTELPLDFILAPVASEALKKAAKREAIPLVCLS